MEASNPAEERAATTSLGELLSEVTNDLSQLMRQELALARAEMKESATRAGQAGGLLGGAGYAALMAVFFLSLALWWALGTLIGGGWSAVVVAAIWALAAVILFVVGRARMKQVAGAPQTAESLGKIPDALKRNEENR